MSLGDLFKRSKGLPLNVSLSISVLKPPLMSAMFLNNVFSKAKKKMFLNPGAKQYQQLLETNLSHSHPTKPSSSTLIKLTLHVVLER